MGFGFSCLFLNNTSILCHSMSYRNWRSSLKVSSHLTRARALSFHAKNGSRSNIWWCSYLTLRLHFSLKFRPIFICDRKEFRAKWAWDPFARANIRCFSVLRLGALFSVLSMIFAKWYSRRYLLAENDICITKVHNLLLSSFLMMNCVTLSL